MAFVRALRSLIPHIVIVGGLAAIYHAVSESHYGLTDLIGNSLFRFSWHAIAQLLVALLVLAIAYPFVRLLRAWRSRRFEKLLRQLEESAQSRPPHSKPRRLG